MADPEVPETPEQVPDLVPARMVNEFTYCPRLFFLEWVQGRFADNIDTVEGRYQHRRVDQQGGAAPLPAEGEVIATRSLMLSSAQLGLVARIDLLEGADGAVRPVDTKHGSPPDTPEQAWEPERIQLCVQCLLLREAGYACAEGVLYFAAARRRVTVAFDDNLVGRTLALVEALRRVAGTDVPPPPLLDSPKCPRCSLVGICLPDETNALLARQDWPVRRLLPRDPSPRPLYLTTQGASLGHREGRIVVAVKGEPQESVRLIDVSQVCIFGNVQVSAQLLRELFAREIPVCWFSYGGWFSGMAEGLPSKHVELRRRQVGISSHGGLAIARHLVEGKVRNCRTLLRRNAREGVGDVLTSLQALAEKAAVADTVATLLGVEGAAARLYFSKWTTMIREDLRLPGAPFTFEGRGRRPPPDSVNCLLSYCYALVVKDLTATAHAVGFDPYLGFYHRPRFGRPALALDVAEEFRPLIAESVVLTLLNNGEIRPSQFIVRAGGVALTADGRKAVLTAYERRLDHEVRHPTFGYTISYRRVLEVQLRVLAAHVLGEVPDYIPFMTR